MTNAVGPLAVSFRELCTIPDIACEFCLPPCHQAMPEDMLRHAESLNYLAILLKDTSRMVGFLGLVPYEDCPGWIELRYAIHPDFRGQGIAKEALKVTLPRVVGRDDDIEGLVAFVSGRNCSSIALARSVGMRPIPWPGRKADVICLGMDREAVLQAFA